MMEKDELLRVRGMFHQAQGTPIFQVGMKLLKEIERLQRQNTYVDALADRVTVLESFLNTVKDDLPSEKMIKAYEIL